MWAYSCVNTLLSQSSWWPRNDGCRQPGGHTGLVGGMVVDDGVLQFGGDAPAVGHEPSDLLVGRPQHLLFGRDAAHAAFAHVIDHLLEALGHEGGQEHLADVVDQTRGVGGFRKLGVDALRDGEAGGGGGTGGVEDMDGLGHLDDVEVFDEDAFAAHRLGADARAAGQEVVLLDFGNERLQ